MTRFATRSNRWLIWICLTGLFWSGCEGSSAPVQTPENHSDIKTPIVPPTASLNRVQVSSSNQVASLPPSPVAEEQDEELDEDLQGVESDPAVEIAELEEGSPEWLIREITRLRTAPLDVVRQPIPGKPNEFEEVHLTPEQIQQEQARRAVEIIDKANQVIAKTHNDPTKEQLFNNAVYYLVDTRMQRALTGEVGQAEALVQDAEALFKRDETSFAAVEAASKVVQLTQTQAQRYGEQDPKWITAFAQQARLFAEKFPQETGRAALNLIAAGRMCEEMGQPEDALACYSVVEQKFGQTPFADQIQGSLRRLRLPGQPLTEFGGSTHDGGFVSIEQFHGQPLLIVFWASNSEQFRSDLPVVKQVLSQYSDRVNVLGVNLDRDEVALDHFLEETRIGWKHIFYSDPQKRGLKNLVARYYGVTRIPSYWLIDAKGTVLAVDVPVDQVSPLLNEAIRK